MAQRQATYEHVSPVRPNVHPLPQESPKRKLISLDNVDASPSEIAAYLLYKRTANNLIKGYDPKTDTIYEPRWVKDQKISGEMQKTGFYYEIRDVQTRVKCSNCCFSIRKDFGVIANTKTHLWIKLSLLLIKEYTLFFEKHYKNRNKRTRKCQETDRYTEEELESWKKRCKTLQRASDIQERNPGESYPNPRSYHEGVVNSVPLEERQGEASGKVRIKKKTGLGALFKFNVWNGVSST